VLRIFFALKYPTASAGFEPANLGTKGHHTTSRPPKPLCTDLQTLDLPGTNLFLHGGSSMEVVTQYCTTRKKRDLKHFFKEQIAIIS
jgi:hypothetical protein